MEQIVFSGSLAYLELSELIQLIGNNGSTGVLKIQSKFTTEQGTIYFVNGNPIDAITNKLTGLPALFALFGWQQGTFSFSQTRVTATPVIHKNRMEIILEGLRKVDDGEIKLLGAETPTVFGGGASGKLEKMIEVKGPQVDYVYVVDEESFKDGEIIAQEGRHGGWLWVVLEGMVDIVKETEKDPVVILRLSEGAFVGSFAAFLPGDHVRSAAAIARGDVQLGVLDSPRLAGEFASMDPDFRQFLISMDRRLKEVTQRLLAVEKSNGDAGDSPRELEPFALDGENKDKLFFIKKGRAAVVRQTDYGQLRLANLVPGDFFGRVPFLETGHEPYAASVYVSQDLETLTLDDIKMQNEYHRQSSTIKNLIEHVSACISITTRLLSNKFLKRKGAGNR